MVTAVLGKMYGSSAINNIKFKCDICSMPHAISGVERTYKEIAKLYFKNGIMVYDDNDLRKESIILKKCLK